MRRLAAFCGVFLLGVVVFGAFGAGARRSTNTYPVVTLDPSAETVCAGDQTDFQSAAIQDSGSSLPPGGLQWQVSVSGGPFADVPGATGNPLHLVTSAADDGNNYRAEWSNTTTSDPPAFSNAAQLTVDTRPELTLGPVAQTVAPGLVTFTAAASASPAPSVQWQVFTPGSVTDFVPIPGATSTTYTFVADGSDDGNQYRAVFTNACNPPATTDSALLTVQSLPVVTTNPASVGPVSDGTPVSFTAAASGFPVPTVQWQYSFDGGSLWLDLGGETSTTLDVTASGSDDGYEYRAAFTNRVGTTFSDPATLTVHFVPQVVDQPQDQVVCPANDAGFFSDARADPTATEQWQSSPDNTTWTPIPGATSNTLSFTPVPGDNGLFYRAVFTNSVGPTDSDSALLTLATTPVVTLDPVDTSVAPDTPATFTVAAVANPTPLVSWQSSTDGGVSWFPVFDEPSTTLTFTPSASADGNEYRAVFHIGECAQVFTTAATLHVVAPVPAPLPPGPVPTTLTSAGPIATLTTDGSLPGDVGVLGGTDSVTWPAGAFGPAAVTLDQTAGVGNVAGFAAPGAELSLTVTAVGGAAITSFPVPLVLHLVPSAPPPFVPSYSSDGLSWVPIPQLALPQLPPGQPDGYFLNVNGSIDIYTRHATLFSVLEDVQAPSAPVSLQARYTAGKLTFTWGASTDNVGVTGYTLLANATPESIPGDTTTFALRAAPGTYSLHAADGAGNQGTAATLRVVARPRPKAIPRTIPRWAFQLLAGNHAKAPKSLPRWYAAWKNWRLNPYTFTA